MKKLASLFAAIVMTLFMIVAPTATSAEQVKAGITRIVVQVNEDDTRKWNGILANIHNIQAELGKDKVAIAVVAIGPGLDMLMADSLAANGVQDAIADGIEFIACGNTMNARKIEKKDLIDGIGYARAGYVEIVRRQQAGWSYLRP